MVKTFLDKGHAREQLARHIYGYDEKVYYPSNEPRDPKRGLTMISVGVCAVRKGLHYALEAWLRSPASKDGTFLIAGEFLPAYQEKLASMLEHPSVRVLGHRKDVPELVRKSDILVLPSIEEGFGLVITEAMGSGCVPLASDACTEICSHMKTALFHQVGDVAALTQHITMLHENRALLESFAQEGVTFKLLLGLLGLPPDGYSSMYTEKPLQHTEQEHQWCRAWRWLPQSKTGTTSRTAHFIFYLLSTLASNARVVYESSRGTNGRPRRARRSRRKVVAS